MITRSSSVLVRNIRWIFNAPAQRKMSAQTQQDDVILKEQCKAGIIVLNRPKALNALNLSMIEKILPSLKQWECDKSLVIVKGAGEKAFCAGGDVKTVILEGMAGRREVGFEFFKKEYFMNGLIGCYKIPYIAIIDGIVMGGGVGLSVHGKYRVATERTLFAMPETQIGFFPDVGGSYFLSRLQGKLGWYLALTGQRLKGADVLHAGIATHLVNSCDLKEVEAALVECSCDADVKTALDAFSKKDLPDFSLQPHMAKINCIFGSDKVEDILSGLECDDSKWAKETKDLLNKMSPTSLKVAMKQLDLGKRYNLQDCLKMEYSMSVNFLKNKDFYEGVRALLIDKDQKPAWDPPKIEDVTEQIVNGYFTDLPKLKNMM
ncbi:unnamed protein product [Phyllotreta striolata]|uniref:3-hydroxyisobutyryl-CoA hydrolase, mitochondrial n=1 Tax=Phyllotreta striolata TaxID=444603 RepID=A0A9N9TRI9_PHYSR|nr:unnamed protein product [Phyllotreta striolata]